MLKLAQEVLSVSELGLVYNYKYMHRHYLQFCRFENVTRTRFLQITYDSCTPRIALVTLSFHDVYYVSPQLKE